MFWHIFLGCCILIFTYSDANETPGFFLKVSKNVPRLGRRSNTAGDFENFFLKASKSVPRIGRRSSFVDNDLPEEMTTNWWKKILTPSKRDVIKPYNYVHPMDSDYLIHLITSNDVDANDFRFVSWKDFDSALESDDNLHNKLISLGKAEHDIQQQQDSDKYDYEHFVPLSTTNKFNKNDVFYRTNRRIENNQTGKERIEYQM